MGRNIISVLLILSVSGFAAAEAQDAAIYRNFMEMLTGTYIDSVSDLPQPTNLKPSVNWQQNGHISAWVDIEGFKNTVHYNGISYINGSPADSAIVGYDAKAEYLCSWCVLVSIEKHLSVYDSGNNTIAVLRVVLHYNEVITNCDDSGCWTTIIPHIETATFYASSPYPLQYPHMSTSQIYVTVYNTTFEPKTTVRFMVGNAMKTTVSYHGSNLTHSRLIGHVEYTDKGVPFMNLTSIDSWDHQGNEISHIGGEYLINGTTNPTDITIKASSPIETLTAKNYSVSIQEPSPPFNAVFLPFALCILILWVGTTKILRTIKL